MGRTLLGVWGLTSDDDRLTVDEVGGVDGLAVVFAAVGFGQQRDLEVRVVLMGRGGVQGLGLARSVPGKGDGRAALHATYEVKMVALGNF